MDFIYCKLEIFIPETHLEALRRALQEVDAATSSPTLWFSRPWAMGV